MAKLSRPTRPLVDLRRSDIRTLRTGTALYRVYHAGGRHATAWNRMRDFGPTTSRFDPHLPPPHAQDRSVIYFAGSIPTAVAEVFGSTRLTELGRDNPWLVGVRLAGPVRLLDLAGDWPTRAGTSQAISSGRRDIAREWARAVYEEYAVDGLWYPSSMSGTTRRPGDPSRHGHAVALFDRARPAIPRRPSLHIPLDHPAVLASMAKLAERYGYGLIP